jgi:hypothetical protein
MPALDLVPAPQHATLVLGDVAGNRRRSEPDAQHEVGTQPSRPEESPAGQHEGGRVKAQLGHGQGDQRLPNMADSIESKD